MTTDPDQSARLIDVRPARPPAAFPHAQATKIVTAGLSVSAVFGIVAYLGRSAADQEAAAERDLRRAALTETLAAILARPPATAPVTVPVTGPPTPSGAATTVPAGSPTLPATPAVVTVPVPVATPAPGRPSSGGGQSAAPAPAATTKTSG